MHTHTCVIFVWHVWFPLLFCYYIVCVCGCVCWCVSVWKWLLFSIFFRKALVCDYWFGWLQACIHYQWLWVRNRARVRLSIGLVDKLAGWSIIIVDFNYHFIFYTRKRILYEPKSCFSSTRIHFRSNKILTSFSHSMIHKNASRFQSSVDVKFSVFVKNFPHFHSSHSTCTIDIWDTSKWRNTS